MLAEIKALLGFAEKAQTKLDALTASQAEVNGLREQVTRLTAEKVTAEAAIARLSGELETAKTAATAQATEITTLKSSVETERKRANDVIAGQGLPADQLPAAAADDHGNSKKPKAVTKYNELRATNPRAAGQFYLENSTAILAGN